MTHRDQDPFERLAVLTFPEPDPAKVNSVVAASSRAFAQNIHRPGAARSGGWATRIGQWLSRAPQWAVPATAVAFCLVVGISVLPLLTMPIGEPSGEAQLPGDMVAGSDNAALPPDNDVGIRYGAQPGPPGHPIDIPDDIELEPYAFDDIELGMRNAREVVTMYVLEGGNEYPFDSRVKESGQHATISDAFIYTPLDDRPPVLLVRSGFDNSSQRWEAFLIRRDGYALSGSLTLKVNDATSRDEVVERLESSSQ